METINVIKEFGGTVQDVIVIVNRQEAGEEKLNENGIKLYSLLDANESAKIAYKNKYL